MNKRIIYKILCLLPYPNNLVPGQRFRWEQWEDELKKKNIILKKICFTDSIFYKLQSKNYLLSIIYYFYLYFIFFFKVFFLNYKYNNFIIFRNCTLGGPPVIEYLLKIFNKKLIFDFDDAIHLGSENNDSWFISKFIRCDWKIKLIIKISNIVICGNKLLYNFSKKYNSNSFVIPTTIDLDRYKIKKNIKKKEYISIGWSGSYSTSKYIDNFLPILFKLQKEIYFKIILIGSKYKINNLFIKTIAWNPKTEVADLSNIDIGLMPLPKNSWTEGKCGLKILQYLSLGIPAVVSKVGINSQIIKNNYNGYIIDKNSNWIKFIKKIILKKKIDIELKKNCRKTVSQSYSKNIACKKLKCIFNKYL